MQATSPGSMRSSKSGRWRANRLICAGQKKRISSGPSGSPVRRDVLDDRRRAIRTPKRRARPAPPPPDRRGRGRDHGCRRCACRGCRPQARLRSRRGRFEAGVILRMRSRHRLQHQRGVADIARDRTGMRGVVEVADRDERHPAIGRLQSEHAAEVTRNADRSCGVGALMQRPIARRRGGGRAAGRRAGLIAVLPWVMRVAGQRPAAQARPAELGRGRLADHDRARSLEPLRRTAHPRRARRRRTHASRVAWRGRVWRRGP